MDELRSELEQALGRHGPKAELLLPLAPLMPAALATRAALVCLSADLPPAVRSAILERLAEVAGPADRDWLRDAAGRGPRADAASGDHFFSAALLERLARLDEHGRRLLLEPLIGGLERVYLTTAAEPPAREDEAQAANGGGEAQPPPPGRRNGGDRVPPGTTRSARSRRRLGMAPEDSPPSEEPPPDEAPAPDEAPPAPKRRPRVVSTGFSSPDRPRRPLPRAAPLEPSAAYLFWFEVGKPVAGSIEERPAEILPEETLPAGARLRIVLYPYAGELGLEASARDGELVLGADGRLRVLRQPGAAAAEPKRDERRLLFPLRTPAEPGLHRLRCNVYFRNVLVQSRIVSARVGSAVAGERHALSAKLDYSLARLLSPAELAPVRPHALSLLINSNGQATHDFRYLASDANGASQPFIGNARLREGALQDVIEQARGALRFVSWGSRDAWTSTSRYRYAPGSKPDLLTDLVELLRKGRQIYDALINDLVGGANAAERLRELMLSPGRVQIVGHGRPSELVPASILYDYDNAAPERGGLSLCPRFVEAMSEPAPLEESDCFSGQCPSRDTDQVVCPSGFWGFRHAIGMPVAGSEVPPAPLESRYEDAPGLGLAIYPGFDLVSAHHGVLAAHDPAWAIDLADTYDETLALLRARRHIVYFYCHGGISPENVPYLQVGPEDGPPLVRPALRWKDPDRYRAPRMLVIVNGCQTAALEPDRAMEFVSAFVENVGAMGVIGTEVTVFEELAVEFGDHLLRELRAGREAGEAVRRSRLALLKKGNPLGLVYLPLLPADARLVRAN